MPRSLLLAIPVALLACVGLPDSAMPQVRSADPSARTRRSSDVIRYRKLARADFKAAAPPAQFAEHAARMGAYTCGQIVAKEPIAIRIEPEGDRFVARAPTLAIHAEMDRRCSWWNDRLQHGQPPAYILQHEQIHFALFELAARDMQERGRALARRARSIEAAQAAFQRALDALRDDGTEKMQARNAAFDRDTSGVYRPDVQQRWYDRVHSDLAKLAR